MQQQASYNTISQEISRLQKLGFTADFNLKDGVESGLENFAIVQVYRYEGETDPSDQACIYSLVSQQGKKGILVTGYGMSIDDISQRALSHIHF